MSAQSEKHEPDSKCTVKTKMIQNHLGELVSVGRKARAQPDTPCMFAKLGSELVPETGQATQPGLLLLSIASGLLIDCVVAPAHRLSEPNIRVNMARSG